MAMFATLSHGKLTSWEQVAAANGHNGRTIEVPNARADGHPPIEMIERAGNDLTERMRGRLAEAGIQKPRANAVLGFEDIYGASPGYWEERYPDGWQNVPVAELMQDPLVQAVTAFAQQKHGKENVVSITWHLDEKTPHAHVVSMPIVTREHKRRGRKRKDQTEAAPVTKTTLAADQLRGGSKYALEKEHDEWAAFVSHLGLKRGQRGSQLSAEELRDRRLRDRQASLAGERRAGERQAEVEQSAAAMLHLRQMGEKDRDGLIEQGRVQAEAQLAAAKIDAENIRKAALAEASEAKAAADRRAGELDQRELALANQSTLHLAEAKARAQSLANREAKVAEGEKSLAVERVQIGRNLARAEAKARSLDLREKALTAKETTLSGLIAELEPVLATVRGALERLRTAPAEVLHWLDPAGAVAKAARAGNSLMDQAKAVVRSHGDQPRAQGQKPITVPQEPPGGDLSVQAAFAAQKEGLGR